MEPDAADADGPPLPPAVRRRRRRRTSLLLVLAFLVVGIPLVMSIADQTRSDGEVARDGGGDSADDGARDEGSDDRGADGDRDVNDGDEQGPSGDGGSGRGSDSDPWSAQDALPRPDASQLQGADAAFAGLLAEVDASELTMIGFQTALREVFDGLSGTELDEVDARIRGVAEEGQQRLLEVRQRLEDPLGGDAADEVREVYLAHLDSWSRYMAAIADDPTIVGDEERTQVHTLSINVTADAFARSLEDQLPDDVDADVRALADGILDRGFRGFSDSNV